MYTCTQLGLPVAPYGDTHCFTVVTEGSYDGLIGIYPATLLRVADNNTLDNAKHHFVCRDDEISSVLDYVNTNIESTQECYVTAIQAKCTASQKDIENTFYQADFHLDAREWFEREYASLTDDRSYVTSTFRRIKQTGHPLCNLSNLLVERDLHMDMLREFSGRSDGHVFRYAFAQSFIRNGDKLLDCACGLGYGSYLMSLNDNATHVTGVDICENSVGYANQVYGHDKLNYQTFDIDKYANATFDGFDLITSFETIEHIKDYHSFFKLCLRCLKPDGRIIASVPYMWVDETGKDPNPYHFHEFDWEKFKLLFEQYGLLIEERYHQTAPGGFKLPQSPRRFEKSALDAPESETEWLLIVATPDLTHPLWQEQQKTTYINPQYSHTDIPHFVDFASGYQNPWLHRQIVQVGQRIQDNDVRLRYINKLLEFTSSDRLMLLTLRGYVGQSVYNNDSQQWLSQAGNELALVSSMGIQKPFALRWYVSLAFLTASKYLDCGEYENASRFFKLVTQSDCNAFCSVLNIKIIEAHYHLAKIAVFDMKIEEALEHLSIGKSQVFSATEVFKNCVNQKQDHIADFLWSEMAELYDAGALLNKLEIALKRGERAGEVLRKCTHWEKNKRFGLFNLVEKYRKSTDLTFQADMQLVAQSYVNKLVSKFTQLSSYEKVYIWGTGVVAKQVYRLLKSKRILVHSFIDSNARVEQTFEKLPVVTPNQVEQAATTTVILTSVGSSQLLAETLMGSRIQCVYIA